MNTQPDHDSVMEMDESGWTRRTWLTLGVAAAAGGFLGMRGAIAAAKSRSSEMGDTGIGSSAGGREQIDRVEIQQIVLRERISRDMQRWDDLAACYNTDSWVDMSWFIGTGAAFAKASAKMAAGGLLTFHEVGPTFIEIRGNRALADSGMTLHVVTKGGGADIDLVGYIRMHSRVERKTDSWLISGMRSVYIHDLLVPQNPSRVPQIDPAAIEHLRSSYRYLAYVLSQSGHPTRDDLPGIDKPETVSKLLAAEEAWLRG